MARSRKASPDDPYFLPDPDLFDPESKHLLYAITLRSQTVFGDLLAITHLPLPAGVTLILSEDIPGNPSFSVYRSRMPILASETLQYKGEPCAILVGPQKEELLALAQTFEFIARKKSLGMGEDEGPFKIREINKGVLPAYDDPRIRWVEGLYTTSSQDSGNQLPMRVTALEKNGVMHLSVPSQWPSHVVQAVSKMLVWDPAKVHIKPHNDSANCDSQLWYPSLLACHAALAAFVTKKPVELILSKEEEFYFSPKRPESRFHLRSALSPQGRIVFMTAKVSLNLGAYGIFEKEFIDRALMGLLGLYQIDGWQLSARADRSHTPPRGPMCGFGESLGLTAMEAHVLDLAQACDQDPAEWKLANLYDKETPYFGGLPFKDSFPLRELAQDLFQKTDFARKHAAYHLLHQKRHEFTSEILPLRGVGMSFAFQGNGFCSADTAPASIEVRLELSGKVSVYCGFLPSTPKLKSRWRKVSATILQVHERDIRFCKVHSGEMPDAGPSTASRTLEMAEKILIQCCEAVAARRFKQALPISIKRPFRRAKHLSWDDDAFEGTPFVSFSWGSCMVEIEINPVQAQLTVKRTVVCVEAGEILDEIAAKTAVIQGLYTGLGWALLENLPWEGHAITRAAFLKYRMPSLRELGEVEIYFLKSDKYQPPKGLGDLGVQLMSSSLMAAFRQALGFPLKTLPVTRKMIDDALRSYED